jgi:hypothetical protein
MFKYLSTVCIGLLFFVSCSGEKTTTQNKPDKPHKVAYSIEIENIFDTTAIKMAEAKATREQKAESRKLFLQGLDLLANKNKAAESVEFFKESICYYPDGKNYLHLFKAYVYSSDTDHAEKVNELITTLAPQWNLEYYEIDFNAALIAAVKKDTNVCIMSLSDGLMNGFIFKDRITMEPLFKFMENNLRFQSFVAANFGSDEKLNYLLYKAFVNYYPDVELPLGITADSARSFNYDHYIDYNFATLIPGMNEGAFSRDVTNEYMYVGKFKLESGYAFVYKSFMAIADTLNPVKTFVVTYDTTGKMIENEMIGCYCSPTESKGFVINKDLSININNYVSTWEFDPLEKGYAGNKITGTEEGPKEIIGIEKDGTLKRETVAKTTEAVAKTGG